MEFSLQHLDIIQSSLPTSTKSTSDLGSHATPSVSALSPSPSSVLDELYKQINDLQDKLKLNHRKLLLYEAENQKLIQEKNQLFFESKSSQEKLTLTLESLQKLEEHSLQVEKDLLLTSEKLSAFEKLCQTQTTDLKRLTKFHLKIKDVIKPHVQALKDKIIELELEKQKVSTFNSQLTTLNTEHMQNIDGLKHQLQTLQNSYQNEKKEFIRTYEEQIHFLSKEIVQHQEKTQAAEAEVFRQKKINETKHYIENELVRFKRDQQEHLQQIQDLKIKLINAEKNIDSATVEKQNLSDQTQKLEVLNHELQESLSMTRQQLASKIDEVDKLHLRLKMLEKLNTSLSLSLKSDNT